MTEAAPEPRLKPSAIGLIILLNLIPVFGVLALGWDGSQILLLYWVENLIVGLVTLPRILTARGGRADSSGAPVGQAALGCFFVFHYGLFCLVHGVFAWIVAGSMMSPTADGAAGNPFDGSLWGRTFGLESFWWSVLGVAALHGTLFSREWIAGAAWRRASPDVEMIKPYGRIVVMHLTVLFGAFVLAALRAPAAAVILLCALKAAVELWAGAGGGFIKMKIKAAPSAG